VRNLRHANARVGEQGLGSLDVVIDEFRRTASRAAKATGGGEARLGAFPDGATRRIAFSLADRAQLLGSAADCRPGSELGAARIPFVGADTPKHLAHLHLVRRLGVSVQGLQLRQFLLANADNEFDQETGHDREFIAHALGLAQIEIGRLAAIDHVQQTWTFDETWHRGDLVDCLQRFDKGHVGSSGKRGVRPGDCLVEPGHGACIGASDDDEIGNVAATRILASQSSRGTISLSSRWPHFFGKP
jgi:hypothetical protein